MDSFTVTTSAPSMVTGSSIFVLKAYIAPEHDKPRAGCIYFTAPGLGCSRDYRTTTDRAIRQWFAEHALSVATIERR